MILHNPNIWRTTVEEAVLRLSCSLYSIFDMLFHRVHAMLHLHGCQILNSIYIPSTSTFLSLVLPYFRLRTSSISPKVQELLSTHH